MHDDDRQYRRHAELGDRRAEARAGDPHADAVDEEEVERRVHDRATGGHPQWGAGVLQAAQGTRRGKHDEHPGQSGRGPPQVRDGVAGDVGHGAEGGHRPGRAEPCDRSKEHPEPGREPHPVDPEGQCTARIAGAHPSRDRRGGRVGEEDAQPDEREQDGRGEREAGELGGAEVTHDGGVREDEQGLGDEGTERRDSQGEDAHIQRTDFPSTPWIGRHGSPVHSVGTASGPLTRGIG